MFTRLVPETTLVFFLLMVLGYLEQGYLSRPAGGMAAFRDALVATYRSLGGETIVNSTVDEVVVRGDRVRSLRYDGDGMRKRMAEWKTFDPIVLASFGVAARFADVPSLMTIDRVPQFEADGRVNDSLMLRMCNDDPCFAPAGHTVIQALVPTDYEWWATRGAWYNAEKDALVDSMIGVLASHFPWLREPVRMTDLATPLTY